MRIEDFDKSEVSIEDFTTDAPDKIGISNRSASMVAASQALLTSPDMENYLSVKESLTNPEKREEFVTSQVDLRRQIFEGIKPTLVDTVARDDLADEDRLMAMSLTSTNPDNIQVSTLKTLQEQTLVAESTGETERTEESRNLLAESFDRVLNYRRRMQSHINDQDLENSTLESVVDVGEQFAPLVEWVHFNRLSSELNPDKNSIKLLGQLKDQAFDTLRNTTLAEREQVATGIIQIVRDHENLVLPDGNDMMTLETLENMLLDNDYSNVERWIDNVTSILDIIGIGAVGRSALKGSKATKTLADEAREFRSQDLPTDSALQAEADSFVPEAQPIDSKLKADAAQFKSDPEPEIDTVFRKATSESVVTDVAPTSPSQLFKDTNPELARGVHREMLNDATGEFANAAYGTNKVEAEIKDVLPEPVQARGRMNNKVALHPEDADIRNARRTEGNIILSEVEEASIRSRITSSLNEVEGMRLQRESITVDYLPTGVTRYTARFSPPDSGMRTAAEMLEAAQVALRAYRINPEDLTLMARFGDEWVETTTKTVDADLSLRSDPRAAKELGEAPVDYAVGIKLDHKVEASDLDLIHENLDLLTTSNGLISKPLQSVTNFSMPSRARQGSAFQHLLDPASTIHPQIVGGASVAVDRASRIKKLYVDMFEDFTKGWNKLKDRRALLTDYIHAANRDGIPFDETDLHARGLTDDEVNLLKLWRRANDVMWHAANDDMGITLRSKGYKFLVHNDKGTKLLGRPVSRLSRDVKATSFDPVTDSIVQFDKDKLDELYEVGGEVFKLQSPIEIDGRWVDQVISHNRPGTAFSREIFDGEPVLAYRDGYYPVMYDANWFIEKVLDGEGGRKVVASARNSKEVDNYLKGLARSENLTVDEVKKLYVARPDRRAESTSGGIFEEGQWEISSSAGLSMQRFRGEKLADAGDDLHKLGTSHLKDPLEAITHQIHSLSQRAAVRNYLEIAKRRWQISYGPYLDLPKFKGQDVIPDNVNSIVGKPNAPAKMVADAKTNFNYLYALENGYINGIDQAYKAGMNKFAKFVGGLGIGKAEEAAWGLSRINPAQALRTTAFKLLISANPARQAIIQRGQIFMLASHNPKYSVGQLQKDWFGVNNARYNDWNGKPINPKYAGLWEELKESGVIESVDAHTLIRDDLLRLADFSVGHKVSSAIDAPFKFMQKVGFDLGEQDVLITAWLSARDKALKAGKDITTARVKDEIKAEARAFTLQMNRAGEMPYSHNTLALMAQFFSFRHKALIQPFTNRTLTPRQRLQLGAYTTAMFGMDATIAYYVADKIFGTEPSEVKDRAKDGLLDWTFNWAATEITGQDQMIDWGDLAPSEVYGIGNLFTAGLTNGFADMLKNSPSGGLLFGGNPRLTDAFKTGYRYFTTFDNYEDDELRINLGDVIHTTLSTTSGYSNFFKARYARQAMQKMSSSGRITDSDITEFEAAMTAFGFSTKVETGTFKANQRRFGEYKADHDDVQMWYNELKRHLTRRWDSPTSKENSIRVLQEAWRVFGDDREAVHELVLNMMERDAKSGDHNLIQGLISEMGFIPESDLWDIINELPSGNQRDQLTKIMKTKEELRGDDN